MNSGANILKNLCILILAFGICSNAFASEKPSVLFINIDDLNDWNEVLGGHPQAITPNMKRLADMGTTSHPFQAALVMR